MISVNQAEQIIQKNLKAFPAELRVITDCLNAVLREDVYADRDAPAFDKALMDGIIINAAAPVRKFKIIGMQRAGYKQLVLKNKNACLEISTGAIVSKGCNCIIPIEQVDIKEGYAYLKNSVTPKAWQYIQRQGVDHKKGAKLLKKGMILTPPRIGIAAQAGKTHLSVSPKLSVAIISTGDELIAILKKPKLFQIRTSNSYALDSAFRVTEAFSTKLFHIRDDKKILYSKLKTILNDFDVVVLSGGVSMGKFDYVPEILKQLGVQNKFHKVAQKPGRPFWFGVTKKGKPVFALPGNPVSTLVCAYRYALPETLKALGYTIKTKEVSLSFKTTNTSAMTHFLPVVLKTNNMVVDKLPYQGSGDFGALSQSDGFVEIPVNKKQKLFHFYSWSLR